MILEYIQSTKRNAGRKNKRLINLVKRTRGRIGWKGTGMKTILFNVHFFIYLLFEPCKCIIYSKT